MASTQNPNALAWGRLSFTGENLGIAQRETISGLVLASTHLSLQPPECAGDYMGTGGLHTLWFGALRQWDRRRRWILDRVYLLILSFKKIIFALITLKIIAYLYFSTYLMCMWRNWFTPSTMWVLETDLRSQTRWQVLYPVSRLVGPQFFEESHPQVRGSGQEGSV